MKLYKIDIFFIVLDIVLLALSIYFSFFHVFGAE